MADTVCTHSHALLLLVQLDKIVTTAHEQTAITKDACWKHNFSQLERGVPCDHVPSATGLRDAAISITWDAVNTRQR